MKRLLYVIFTGCLMSLFFVSGLAPSPSIPIARAQGCSIIDTVTVIAQDTITTGSVATKAGRRYEYRVSGDVQEAGSTRHDLFHFTTNDWASSGADWLLVAGNYITGLRGTSSYPAYSGSHEYTIDAFGTGSPVQARIHYGTGTISIIIEVCEYPPDYAIPTCTIIDRMDVVADGATHVLSSVTLTNAQSYTIFIAGESSTSTLPSTNYDYLVDPYWQTNDGWSTQSAASGFVGIINYTSFTLVDTTFQPDHIYEADVVGGGLQLDAIVGFGFGSRGGVEIYICDNSITPTPAMTSTPTPTPIPGGLFARTCVLLGTANANFTAGNAWSYSSPDMTTPSGASTGVRFPAAGGTATLKLLLQPTSQYKVETQYRLRELTEGLSLLSINVALGEGQSKDFPVAISTTAQSGSFGPFNFVPASDGYYNLVLTWNGTEADDPTFIVDWVCVTKSASQSGSPTTPPENQDQNVGKCEDCTYSPTGNIFDDLSSVIRWLWCAFRQFIDCILLPFLIGLWTTLRNIGGFFVSVQRWAVLVLASGGQWIISFLLSIIYWVGGWLYNVIYPILSWLENVFHSLRSLDTFLRALLGSSPATDRIVEFFSSIYRAISDLLYVAQILLFGFQSGVTASSSLPVQYAPQCFDPSSVLYYPCLGLYVAENTVLDGPVFYLVPLVMGVISWNVGLWAIRQVIKTLSQV